MPTLDERVANLINVNGQALGVLKTLTTLVGNISGKLSGVSARAPGAPAPGAKGKAPKDAPGLPGAGGLGGLVGKLGPVGAALGAVVGAIAGIPAALVGIVSAATKFVRALNPSLVEQYETQLENLTATIGFALVPIVSYATQTVKQFAGILLPIVQRLQPVVEQLAHAVSGAVGGAFRALRAGLDRGAAILERIGPALSENISQLGDFFDIVGAVVQSLGGVETIADALADAFKVNADGLRTMARALAIASAKLIGAFGGAEALNKFKAGLKKAIEDRKNPVAGGLTAAPKDATIGGIDDVLRKLNERAFAAGAGAETKPPDVEALEGIWDVVKGIEAERLGKLIYEGVRKALLEVGNPRNVATAAADAVSGESGSTGGIALAALSPGAALVSVLGGAIRR